MQVRKLSLNEWFLYHQLRYIEAQHFHVDSILEVDFTAIAQAWKPHLPSETLPPLTFLLVKAAGLLLKHEPEINRQFSQSLWGPRLIESQNRAVNVPVMMHYDGEDYLSVTTIQDADSKSIGAIKAEVRAFFKTPKEDLIVGKYILGKPNHVFNRLRLRAIHYLVNHWPQLLVKHRAGLISVSSLLNLDHQGTHVTMQGRGPGAFSITLSHYDTERQQMRIGISWDHFTSTGMVGTRAGITLCRILQNELEPGALFP